MFLRNDALFSEIMLNRGKFLVMQIMQNENTETDCGSTQNATEENRRREYSEMETRKIDIGRTGPRMRDWRNCKSANGRERREMAR